MKRLLVLVALVAVLFSVSAGVASSKLPIFGTADSCASVFTEDASACGGWIQMRLVQRSYNPGSNQTTCTYRAHYMPSGAPAPWYVVSTYNGNIACP